MQACFVQQHWAVGCAFCQKDWCCETARMYEHQILTVVLAVPKGWCKLVLHSSSEQWVVHYAKITVLLCFIVVRLHTRMSNKS